MRLKFLVETSIRLDKVQSKTYPADWVGEVPESLAAELLERGFAVHSPASIAEVPPGQQFTPEQAAVLALAAEEALAAARAENGDGGAGEGHTGAGATDDGNGEPPIELETLLKAELLDLALMAGVEGAKDMRKDELIAALKALQASDNEADD